MSTRDTLKALEEALGAGVDLASLTRASQDTMEHADKCLLRSVLDSYATMGGRLSLLKEGLEHLGALDSAKGRALDQFRTDFTASLADKLKADCGCGAPGQAASATSSVLSAIEYGITQTKSMGATNQNVVWQDILASLNRRRIISNEETEKLLQTRFTG